MLKDIFLNKIKDLSEQEKRLPIYFKCDDWIKKYYFILWNVDSIPTIALIFNTINTNTTKLISVFKFFECSDNTDILVTFCHEKMWSPQIEYCWKPKLDLIICSDKIILDINEEE